MTSLQRRSATEADREFVFRAKAETLRYAVEAAWGWDERAERDLHDKRFDAGGLEILLDGTERAGYLKVRREPDLLRLVSINLLPAWQSRGIGTSLIEELQREAEEAGLPVRLRVLQANVRARALYERLGFAIIETTASHHQMSWPSSEGV